MTRPTAPYGTTYATIEPEPVFVPRSRAEKIASMRRFQKTLRQLSKVAKRRQSKRKMKHGRTR